MISNRMIEYAKTIAYTLPTGKEVLFDMNYAQRFLFTNRQETIKKLCFLIPHLKKYYVIPLTNLSDSIKSDVPSIGFLKLSSEKEYESYRLTENNFRYLQQSTIDKVIEQRLSLQIDNKHKLIRYLFLLDYILAKKGYDTPFGLASICMRFPFGRSKGVAMIHRLRKAGIIQDGVNYDHIVNSIPSDKGIRYKGLSHSDFIYRYRDWHHGYEYCEHGYVNPERLSLIYLLGILEETREHIEEIITIKTGAIHPKCLKLPWVTPLARRTIILAFNLYDNWVIKGAAKDCSPSSIFDEKEIQSFLLEGVRLRYS